MTTHDMTIALSKDRNPPMAVQKIMDEHPPENPMVIICDQAHKSDPLNKFILVGSKSYFKGQQIGVCNKIKNDSFASAKIGMVKLDQKLYIRKCCKWWKTFRLLNRIKFTRETSLWSLFSRLLSI